VLHSRPIYCVLVLAADLNVTLRYLRMTRSQFLRSLLVLALLVCVACNDPARPGSRAGRATNPAALCACKPTHITKDDWRIEFKNGSLPQSDPTDTTTAAILQWPEGPEPGRRTARSGRELILYRIRKAYLQTVFFRRSDCDLHLEISEDASKTAPRMIVETPGTGEYCLARSTLFTNLQNRGITITDLNQEVKPQDVEVIGVPFRDQAHPVWFARGSDKVATVWELHPATVKLLP